MKILIASQEQASLATISRLLAFFPHEIVTAATGKQAWKILSREDRPQVAVLDWRLPGLNGLELCRRLRATAPQAKQLDFETILHNPVQDAKYTYLIILSQNTQKEDIVTGFEAGADDFIIKPFNDEELQARVRAGIRIIELQNSLLEAQRKLRILARTDELTSILNRRAILENISTEIDRAVRENGLLSLAILDIDHFKQVNDAFGHDAGDMVLTECVRRIQSIIRSYDLLGRFGGEEFIFILPGASPEEARQVCERVRAEIGNRPFPLDQSTISLTVSQGLAFWNRADSLDALIKKADTALFKAKHQGRDRVVSFADDHEADISG